MRARREAEAVPGVLRGLATKPSWRTVVAWRQVDFDRGPNCAAVVLVELVAVTTKIRTKRSRVDGDP